MGLPFPGLFTLVSLDRWPEPHAIRVVAGVNARRHQDEPLSRASLLFEHEIEPTPLSKLGVGFFLIMP